MKYKIEIIKKNFKEIETDLACLQMCCFCLLNLLNWLGLLKFQGDVKNTKD